MTANESSLNGRRVLVVGASAGIGRVIGETLCAEGAHVAFASRRKDVCEAAAKEAGGTAIGLECDVTDEAQCQRVVDEAVEGLGGLDDVVYTAGAISLVALAEADAGWWRRTFETNVMGAALVTRAALPHLQRSRGSVVYLSSVASVGAVWPGLGVYMSTKAALNRMIETWRTEHPEVGFTRVLVGPTDQAGTGTQFDPSAFAHMERWPAMGVQSGALSPPSSTAAAVRLVLSDESRISDITVQPKDGPLPWGVLEDNGDV
jgi:NAD(P)-dependent dehydrogenase (short-subunit alcohol dehydrogenase family)